MLIVIGLKNYSRNIDLAGLKKKHNKKKGDFKFT